MEPKIGLNADQRNGVVAILDKTLSDEFVLYTKTRNYHWNVLGPHFDELHKFFEEQYDEIAEIIDEVAERARMLGGRALGSMAEFLEHTRLKEQPKTSPAAMAMVANLLADHEAIIRSLREDLRTCDAKHGDMGASDFLTGLMEKHEKMAWMLRSMVAE